MSISRRVALAGLLLAGALIAGCSSTPAKKELTAQDIVDQASEAMKAVKSVHFRLEMAEGKMALAPGISLDNLEGDAASPDRIQIKTKASIAGFIADLELISVAGKQFLRNPLSKQWEPLPIALSITALFAPDQGASSIMKGATGVAKAVNEPIDGVDSYHVTGKVDAKVIAALVGGQPSVGAVDVEAWIGTGDFLVRKIKLAGPLVQEDPAKIVRTLTLSKFNVPVTIEPPG